MDFNSFGEGFGVIPESEVMALNKALNAGYAANPLDSSMTGGGALRVQSLEATLKVLTFSQKHTVLFNAIPKAKAFSTVEEYSTLSEYGTRGSSFIPEGVLPEDDSATYARKASLVKFIGTTRSVTHPMTLVTNIGGDVMAREQSNGVLKIMRDANDALYWGNNALVHSGGGEGIEFAGLNNLIDPTMDYDMAGANLDEPNLDDVSENIYTNFGLATDLFCSPAVAKILGKLQQSKGRIAIPQAAGDGGLKLGYRVRSVDTQFGEMSVNSDIFLSGGRSPKVIAPVSATSSLAPDAPASLTAGAMTGTDGQFHASQVGAIGFQVTAANRFGESAPATISSPVTVGSGDVAKHIPLTITNPTVVTPPEWFNLYATEAGGSVYYLVAQIPAASQATGGTTTYSYTGYIIPNTSIAFAGQLSPDIITFKQLAPVMRMDLAVLGPAFRFMVLLYGVPQLFAPKKWSRIINIKDN